MLKLSKLDQILTEHTVHLILTYLSHDWILKPQNINTIKIAAIRKIVIKSISLVKESMTLTQRADIVYLQSYRDIRLFPNSIHHLTDTPTFL